MLGLRLKRYLLPEPDPEPVTAIPRPVNPPPAMVASVRFKTFPLVTCPLPALAVTVLLMAVPEVKELPMTWKMVAVVAAESMVMVPLLDWELVTMRFGMVTEPVPKVTGLLVVVLMESVVAVVKSITGELEEILVVTLFKVTMPVPVAKVLEPVTVVAPFNETAPVPVPKVNAPVCENVLSSDVAPRSVKVPGVVVEPIVLMEDAPPPIVFVLDAPEPKVLVKEAPVPIVELPEEVRVVKAPVDVAVAPIAVELMPVAVVLKFDEVIVRAVAPVLIDEAVNPESARAPEVAVMFNAPVVRVNPLDAVSSPAEVIVPVEVVEILLGVVSPEVAVISPEIVGVAVMAVGFMVKVVPDLPRFVAVELTVPRFNTPAESIVVVPEVVV